MYMKEQMRKPGQETSAERHRAEKLEMMTLRCK